MNVDENRRSPASEQARVGLEELSTVPTRVSLSRIASLLIACLVCSAAWAQTIDTALLERPWPKQRVHDYKVGKYPVRWRQRASKTDGILAGATFTAPSTLETTWNLATDYHDLGKMTPGVSSVQFLEDSPTRKVVQVDVKVLWKKLRLRFEIEQDAPHAVRFQLIHDAIGRYRGVCLLQPAGSGTRVDVATCFQPVVRVPSGLVLLTERMVILPGIRDFLKTCEHAAGATATHGPGST